MSDKFVPDYKSTIEHFVTVAKLGSIILLFFMAIFYAKSSTNAKFVDTFLKNDNTRIKGLGASALGAFIACLTTLYIMGSRGFFSFVVLLTVFFILFLHDMGLEASGVNRWLSMADLIEGKGVYAELNDLSPKDTDKLKELKTAVENVDPFYNASMYGFLFLLSIVLTFIFYKLVGATYIGYKSGDNKVSDVEFWGKRLRPIFGFGLEIIFMGLNGLVPLITTKVRGEEITNLTYLNMGLYSTGSVFIHLMFQYGGLYK